jgi:hypothetical protein
MAITSPATKPGEPAVIVLRGDFLQEDVEQFRALTAFIPRAAIVLISDGGVLWAGIEIGRIIRLKGFATLIPDNARCASACAIAWLGGVRRLAGPHAAIGFHAASVGTGGPETGLGNALLGAYLNQIGLPDIAIAYITVASPQSMTWLNFEDARKIGIDVTPFELPQAPAQSQPPSQAQPQQAQTFEGKTREFLADLIERTAGFEAKHYPDNVSYYGRVFTRDAVLSDKRKFNARWPQRRYVMDNATIQCRPSAGTTICDATTQGRWWVSNGQKVGSGTMTGTYRIQWWLDEQPKILLETSVAARDPTPAPSPPLAQQAPPTVATGTPQEFFTSVFKLLGQ